MYSEPVFGENVVHINSPALRDTVVQDACHHRSNLPQRPHSRKYEERKLRNRKDFPVTRPWSTPSLISSNASLSGISSRSSLDQTSKIQNWLSQKAVRNIQEKADSEAKITKQMYMSVLDNEDTFVRDVDNFLLNKDFLDLRKREMLHKKWTDNVDEAVQAKIHQQMTNCYPELDRQKRKLYEQYLRHGNRKGFVYLDTFDTSEYNPLQLVAPRPAPMHIRVRSQSDPLVMQQRVRDNEDSTIIGCTTGETLNSKQLERHRLPALPLVPLGRHGTECNTWLDMPLHDIESPDRHMSRRRMHGTFNNQHFDFSDWPSLSENPVIVEKEMNIQKRRNFKPTTMIQQQAVITGLGPSMARHNFTSFVS